MRNRQFKVRTLAGGLAAITIMSNIGAMTANACELDTMNTTECVETVSDESVTSDSIVSNILVDDASDQIQADYGSLLTNEDIISNVVDDSQITEEQPLSDLFAEINGQEAAETTAEDATEASTETTAETTTDAQQTDVKEQTDTSATAEQSTTTDAAASTATEQPAATEPTTETTAEQPAKTEEEIEKEKAELDAKFAKDMERIQEMSADELIELFMNMDTIKETEISDAQPDDKTEIAKDMKTFNLSEYAEKYAKQLLKEATGKLTDMVIKKLPGSEFYGGTLKGIIGAIIGDDSEEIDLNDVIAKNKEETKNLEISMKREFEVAKKQNIDVTTLENYGERLDGFASKATIRAKSIQEIKDDEELNDAQKAVQIAELIGNRAEWRTGTDKGDIILAMTSAAQCFKGSSDIDMSSRDLYEAIYEFNTHDSLFSGEAMHKSEGFIQKRVQGFIRNCSIVMECFKAHKEVAKFTDEQVATLDPDTKAIYDRIKSDNKNIVKQIRNVAGILFGRSDSKIDDEKLGMFDAAKAYYSKSKSIYIDKNKQNIALQDKLEARKGRDYQAGDFTNIPVVNGYINSSGLKKEDVENIIKHANEKKMTLVEYLAYAGFDTSNLSDGMIAVESYENKPGYWDALTNESKAIGYGGIKGYKIDSKNAKLENKDLSKHEHKTTFFIYHTKDTALNSDINLVNFVKAEGPIAKALQ